ncbi:MAG: hypothetical protein ACI33J_07185 [Clostridium sp.]
MRKNIIRFMVCLLFISSVLVFNPNSKASAASAVIDANISVISVTKNASNGTITVKYKVKSASAASKGICIGYEWPSNYRLSASHNYCKRVASKVGTHTMTIPKPSINIIGTQLVVAKISGRYNEKKNLKSVFNHPTTKVTKYHTVTKSEALADHLVVGGIGVGVKYMKKNAIGFITKAAYAGYTTHYGLKGIGVVSGFPVKSAGQYYKVETWYSSKGLNVKTTIWASKAAFNSKHKPSYTGTAISKW